MTNVLAMTAREFRNPVALVIDAEANDGSLHIISESS
jgi:hypothetical protein